MSDRPDALPADPRVSCLMVTLPVPHRFAYFRQSVADYLRQTYSRRELVIVLDHGDPGAREALFAHVASLGRDDIRLVEVPRKLTLGALRNVSISSAHGDWMCQWDDDDLNHPERISAQVGMMRRSGAQAMCLEETFQYFVATRTLYWLNFHMTPERSFPGSLMMMRSAAPSYPETGPTARRGEDTAGIEEMQRRGGFDTVLGSPHLCVYVNHGANTSGDEHHRMVADRLSLSRALLLRREAQIRDGLRSYDFGPGEVTVRGYNGVAFAFNAPAGASPR